MDLKGVISGLLSTIMNELSYHPTVSPYLKISKDLPIQPYLHQHEVVARLSLRSPIRVLIGDEIGLGKTVTALAVAKYLERVGRVKRVLIVVPRVLVPQWRKELSRMGIPASKVRQIEKYTLDFLKSIDFPEGYYIASMDFLKREERIGEVVNVQWDLIIIDEAHKFGYKTKRFWQIGKMLVEVKPERDVLFLSATPHRGDPKDYILRLRLLDPYLTEWRSLDTRQFYEATHGSILYRRTKEDVNRVYEGRQVFPPVKFYATVIQARGDEAEFVSKLVAFLRTKLVEFAYERRLISEKVIPLLVILIFKRASSSPYAAWTTLERLLIRRAEPEFPKELIDSVRSFLGVGVEDYEYERDPEEVFSEFLDRAASLLTPEDVEQIKMLRDAAKSIMDKGDTKLNALISLLEDVMAEEKTKLIIFTEYKDTADYLIKYLTEKRHPDWKNAIRRLTSEETLDENLYRRIKDAFEKDPDVRILIATDVVAEGVNLQVANILINYEIPWSLIKLEQRIGRVWRLGQTKEVEVYTLFMSNEADTAALRSMYGKLLNLKRALGRTRPVIGQEVVYYADAEEIAKIPPHIAVVEKARRKKFLKVTEGKSILTYIREGEAGLENLIASIIAARNELVREVESKGILYKPKTKEDVEKSINPLGFKNPTEILNNLKEVVKGGSKIFGYRVLEEGGNVLKVIRGKEMPIAVETIDDVFGILSHQGFGSTHHAIVAYGEKNGTVALFPVELINRRDGKTVYRELVGTHIENKQVLRGPTLLNTISQALSSCIGVTEFEPQNFDVPFILMAKVVDEFKRVAAEILSPLSIYTGKLEGLGLRDADKTFLKTSDVEVRIQKPICLIKIAKPPPTPIVNPPEDVKREIEERAVQFVIEVERMEGRNPKRVPETEHYDIESVEAIGAVRLIEVKGHSGSEIFGELTEYEAKLAREKGEIYWLYIVYDIGSGNPKLLRFRDPFRTMNWEIFERVERRYILRPRE